ncbi:MAG: SMI1/KNR4 family protein [Sphingomonas sp.]
MASPDPFSPAQALRALWADDPDAELPRDPRAGVAALERRYGIAIPEDFRDYLLRACPAEDLWDAGSGHDFIWWGLGRIKNIPDEYEQPIRNPEIASEAHRYLFFSDYCIWFWAWAICCSDGPNRGKVAVIGDSERFVANSFAQFVETYRTRPDALH